MLYTNSQTSSPSNYNEGEGDENKQLCAWPGKDALRRHAIFPPRGQIWQKPSAQGPFNPKEDGL